MRSERAGTISSLPGLYDEDFFAWTQRNAELLRAGQAGETDVEHLAEEIEDMGKRDLEELDSRTVVLMMHLLKSQFQPERRSRSWRSTIANQRVRIRLKLKRSTSLKGKLHPELAGNYALAVERARAETGIAPGQFPVACPFTVEQLLDPEFLP